MMKFFSTGLLILTVCAVSLAVLTPVLAHAAAGDTPNPAGPSTNTIDTPAKVKGILEKITNWMFTIFIALAAMMVIYAAFIYLTSGGGEDVSKAHKILLYAAVAIAVATASRGLVALTRNFIEQP